MKRKLPLLLAMAMMVALLCAPVAHAAVYAPSPAEIEIDDPSIPLVEVPEITIYVDAIVDAGTANAAVPEDDLLAAAKVVSDGEAVRITIVSLSEEEAAKQEVALPQKAIEAVVEAGAELRFVTPNGEAIMPNNLVAYFAQAAGEGDIVLVIDEQLVEVGESLLDGQGVDAARIQNGSVSKVYVVCNDTIFYNWNSGTITLCLPLGAGEFEEGSVYTVYQTDENGKNIRTLEGQCMLVNGELRVVVSVNERLGYFVVLPDAVAQNVAVVDPSIITSPLASKAPAETTTGIWASVQSWFDSVANQFMKLFSL